MTPTLDTVREDISTLFPTAGLSVEEHQTLLEDIGGLIVESALLRLLAEIDDAGKSSLEHFMETEPDPQMALTYLFAHYPQFQDIFLEEVEAFKKEALAILS